jgi:cytochrome c biogenesis protein CcmG/thiol:disulfide interchange protein DsbE
MSRGRIIGWALFAAAIAALAVFGLSSTNSGSNGRRAPALPREVLSGTPTTLASLLAGAHGSPVAIVFWASWCGPCSTEAPQIESFARSAAGHGRIIGVDWNDPEITGARGFIHRFAWSFTNLRDSEGTVGSEYGLTGLPTTFVVDGSGRIRKVLRGPQTPSSLQSALGSV